MLLNFFDVNLYKSQRKAITNFDKQLLILQSDLAKEMESYYDKCITHYQLYE